MLFDQYQLKKLVLKNRIVMAPMTRSRSADGIPNDLNALYYSQRCEAGLIITEGTAISPSSKGFLHIPGLYDAKQIEGWKKVTDAVHLQGSLIFTQLWHVGRISHYSIQPAGEKPFGASDIKAEHSVAYGIQQDGSEGFVPCSEPKALSTAEVKDVVQDFAIAAKNAVLAGFDGIELHGANGYLIEQFLNPFINTRTDQYGGSIENRCRFLLEAVDECIRQIGKDKVAIRLTPYGNMHELPHYGDMEQLYRYLAKELSAKDIAYVHIMDQGSRGSYALPEDFLKQFRSWYTGTIILAGGLTKATAEKLLSDFVIDLAAFGEDFIANPDLVYRMQKDLPFTPADRSLHYGGGEKGYTDWKRYDEIKK